MPDTGGQHIPAGWSPCGDEPAGPHRYMCQSHVSINISRMLVYVSSNAIINANANANVNINVGANISIRVSSDVTTNVGASVNINVGANANIAWQGSCRTM
jgi:hypothetical protein